MSVDGELARLGMRLLSVGEVDSTNRIVDDAARGGEPAGLVVRAVSQTRGRGRQGRSWAAAPGDALLVSFLRRPAVPAMEAPRLTLAVGLAVREVAREIGRDAWVKWPNDVLIGTAKLAGILCEITQGAGGQAIIVGVGINIRTDALPRDLRGRAAGLEVPGRDVDVDEVLVMLARHLSAVEAELEAGGWPEIRSRCLAAMSPMIGADVDVDGASGPRTVTVAGLADDGALLVRAPGSTSQAPERVLAGDVRLRTGTIACFS